MAKHPIATLHYAEELSSIIDRKHIQTNYWQRDFWSKEEINDFLNGTPERPRSYIKRVPRKIVWPINWLSYETASCDLGGNWDETKRVLKMLAKNS